MNTDTRMFFVSVAFGLLVLFRPFPHFRCLTMAAGEVFRAARHATERLPTGDPATTRMPH